tara:strand:+ start:89 stop:571 length:483 start_codon:yes stop_codon:yes gene_type:complete
MNLTKNKLILPLILSLSLFALFAAYFIEFVLGHAPCNLCLIERIPYFASIVLITFTLTTKKYEKTIFIIIGILFLFGAIISFYHVGIEQGVFSESFACKLEGNKTSVSAAELLNELEKKTISCKDVTFKLLGFSLATFNTIISLIVSVIIFFKALNYDQN